MCKHGEVRQERKKTNQIKNNKYSIRTLAYSAQFGVKLILSAFLQLFFIGVAILHSAEDLCSKFNSFNL